MGGFKAFVLRGNVVDLAVGIVIGSAFGAVVTGFVAAFLTPLVGLLAGKSTLATLAVHVGPEHTEFPYGQFLQALMAFLLIAVVLYFFVVVPVNRLMAHYKTEPDVPAPTRTCSECLSAIPVAAARCAFCAQPQPAAG